MNALWAQVGSSDGTSASICHEAGGFPACRRWLRSKGTTPPGTRAKANPGIPAGMPDRGSGPDWHPSRVRRVMGIGNRWYGFAQPPATCCETFGFEQGIPRGPCFRGPRRHSPALGCPGFLEKVNGLGPWDPSACHSIRVQGRIREPKNCLRVDLGRARPIDTGLGFAAASGPREFACRHAPSVSPRVRCLFMRPGWARRMELEITHMERWPSG